MGRFAAFDPPREKGEQKLLMHANPITGALLKDG